MILSFPECLFYLGYASLYKPKSIFLQIIYVHNEMYHQIIEIAYVSSIREISIVIAAIIGLLFLAEKEAKKRIIPSILIVMGISIVYFQL